MKTRATTNPRTWDSIVRNCRSYWERHDDYYDRMEYVQNLARLHNLSFTELAQDVQAPAATMYSSWLRPWSR